MHFHQLYRLVALTVAAGLILPHAAAARQTPPIPAIQERLNRVGADLFSPTPHPEKAIEELKEILAEAPGLPEGHMLLGMAYRAQGSPELLGEAVAELRQALALNPSLALARVTLARVYLDMARAGRAREEIEVALEQMPDHPQLLALLGEAERHLGDPRRSVELNRQALKADATTLQARYYLGLALLDLGQYAEAIQELRTVVKSGANAAEANLALGMAYLGAGRAEAALAALRESARLDPSRPETRLHLSRAHRATGQLQAAEQELNLALTSGMEGLGALYHNVESDLYMEQGLVRLAQGNLERAAESFERVLVLTPGYEPAADQLAGIRKQLKGKAPVKRGG